MTDFRTHTGSQGEIFYSVEFLITQTLKLAVWEVLIKISSILGLKDCIGANNRPLPHLLFNEMNETGLNFMEYMRFSSVIANSLKKFSTNIFQEGA